MTRPKVELPTPLNMPPAPRVERVELAVGGFQVQADKHSYRASRGAAGATRIVAHKEMTTSDPQTNAQRAVQRLVDLGLVTEAEAAHVFAPVETGVAP